MHRTPKLSKQSSDSLSLQALVTHKKYLSGALHCVMNSYFMDVFGRDSRDKVPQEETSDTLNVCECLNRDGLPLEKKVK